MLSIRDEDGPAPPRLRLRSGCKTAGRAADVRRSVGVVGDFGDRGPGQVLRTTGRVGSLSVTTSLKESVWSKTGR